MAVPRKEMKSNWPGLCNCEACLNRWKEIARISTGAISEGRGRRAYEAHGRQELRPDAADASPGRHTGMTGTTQEGKAETQTDEEYLEISPGKWLNMVRAAAKEAYEKYQHRAGKPDYTHFAQLSTIEQQAWCEVVEVLWDEELWDWEEE